MVENEEWTLHSDGTTAVETVSLILPTILTVYITTTLSTLIYGRGKIWVFLLEFSTLLVPIVLNTTVLSRYIQSITIISLVSCVGLLYLVHKLHLKSNGKSYGNEEKRIPFVTNARATINIISVIAILAVDFRAFPRKYAKTSTFGYSLMDLGVGLYIFANSIVSPECLNKKDSLTKIFKSCVPLFILGILRLVLTRQVDYNVPVSEYGVHWNFFITLLFTKCFGSLIIKVAHVKYMRIVSVLILIIHEIFLQNFFQDIVLSNEPRTNFFLANREGISSILGYVSLYLYAVHFGYVMNQKVYNSFNAKDNIKMFISNLLVNGTIAYFLNKLYPTSRMLANSSYCSWVVFVGILAAFCFYLGELSQKKAFGPKSSYVKAPFVYSAINYNALLFFLLGNVFTGLVNISIQTSSVRSDTIALMILIFYVFILNVIMSYLYAKRIKLKIL